MLSPLEKILLGTMVLALMFGVGCGLKLEDFKKIIKAPSNVFIGLALQFLLMPLIAIFISKFFELGPNLSTAVLLVACVPGGSTSNMFSFLSNADVGLSVSLTSLSSILAFVMMPLLVKLTMTSGILPTIEVPIKNIMISLTATLFPIFLGMLLRVFKEKFALLLEKWAGRIGFVCIIIMIAIWVPKLGATISEAPIRDYLVIYSLAFLGMFLAHLIALILKRPVKVRRTLALETGIQNAPLAFAIIGISFGENALDTIGWVTLIYGAFSVSNAINFTSFYKLQDYLSHRKNLVQN